MHDRDPVRPQLLPRSHAGQQQELGELIGPAATTTARRASAVTSECPEPVAHARDPPGLEKEARGKRARPHGEVRPP